MNKQLEKLNEILLSDNVINDFKNAYGEKDFREWLLSILPEIEDCAKTKQDNPWHIYNCLDHILHSVEEINKLTTDCDVKTRRMLSYTMLLHDIGKPECKIRRYSKLYKREIDSFFNHNLAGVKIANRVLKDFGFDKFESDIIKILVEKHDIFMYITLHDDGNPYHHVLTKEYLLNEVNELNNVFNGKQLMQYLLWVGRADNKAQNPKMTTDSLHLLDVMEDMLKKEVK